MLKKVVLLGVSALTAFAMNTGEININDKDLEVSAQFDIGQFNKAVEPNTMFLGAKFLNADGEHSDNDNADLDPYFEANFLLMQPMAKTGLRLGMGVKANYTKDFITVPLGLQFAYKLPLKTLIPMFINGAVYYAPTALSFSDADSFLECRASFDIQIIKNGNITIGYRRLDTNYEVARGYLADGDFTYNSSWYVGFKINF
jgi:hypothetical protein